MLRTITPNEMKRVEQRVLAETESTGSQLMERAAGHVAEAVALQLLKTPGRVLCLCGTGNNGGDGLAAARLLCVRDPGQRVTVWLLGGALTVEARRQKERLEQEAPGASLWVLEEGQEALPPLPADVVCVVDGLFGTGLSREVTGLAAALCRLMQALYGQGIPVVAIDIPSGLHGQSGIPLGVAVRATQTVTFHRPKPGLYLGHGPDYAGEVLVAPIGISAACDDAAGFWVAEEEDIRTFFPARPRVCHKNSFGRVLVVAGSVGMAGAAAICALAALRAGAGLVTVACPEEITPIVQTLCPCATCLPLPADDVGKACQLLAEACHSADALALGPGLGQGAYAREIAGGQLAYLQHSQKPGVIDADGLNLLAGMGALSAQAKPGAPCFAPCHILTPHPAEAARLLGVERSRVTADALEAAQALRDRYGASIVLKGVASVLVSGQEAGLNVLGTPGLAKGGSGDALTGVLAALLAGQAQGSQRLTPLALLQAGTGLHGLAGRAAAKTHGVRGMLATDLCEELGRVGSRE